LDSVKVLTNKFKGGLAAKTANALALEYDNLVEVVKWSGTSLELHPSIKVHNVEAVSEYSECLRASQADVFVLAAAVANLQPTNPWVGKFPSHEHAEGQTFDIEFEITPRVINAVRGWHPKAVVVGYKLFDGTHEQLIAAGTKLRKESGAHVVFCNTPEGAKSEKHPVVATGPLATQGFAEHVDFIARLVNLKWYTTKIASETYCIDAQARRLMTKCLQVVQGRNSNFGSLAVRQGTGFITTTRGHRDSGWCKVLAVDSTTRTVCSTAKATLNAPLLEVLFGRFPDISAIVHSHKYVNFGEVFPYAFPGTQEETVIANTVEHPAFNVTDHGSYTGFESLEKVAKFLVGG